jgi:hypothetical protein
LLSLNKNHLKKYLKFSNRLITFGEIDTLFGDVKFEIPFDLVGDIICCVNIGRIATGGDIASFCFDFLWIS